MEEVRRRRTNERTNDHRSGHSPGLAKTGWGRPWPLKSDLSEQHAMRDKLKVMAGGGREGGGRSWMSMPACCSVC